MEVLDKSRRHGKVSTIEGGRHTAFLEEMCRQGVAAVPSAAVLLPGASAAGAAGTGMDGGDHTDRGRGDGRDGASSSSGVSCVPGEESGESAAAGGARDAQKARTSLDAQPRGRRRERDEDGRGKGDRDGTRVAAPGSDAHRDEGRRRGGPNQ